MGRFNSAIATTAPAAPQQPVMTTAPAAPQQPVMTTQPAAQPAAPQQQAPAAPAIPNSSLLTPNSQPAPAIPHSSLLTPNSQPAPTAKTKTQYVAPANAQEAHDRILKAVFANTVVKTENGANVEFRGNTYGLKDCFRLLGGEFKDNMWIVPLTAWTNPASAVASKSEAQIRKEKADAEREAEIQKRIAEAIEADRKQRPTTIEGMIRIEDAKANTKKALKLMLEAIANMPEKTIDACVNKAYSK